MLSLLLNQLNLLVIVIGVSVIVTLKLAERLSRRGITSNYRDLIDQLPKLRSKTVKHTKHIILSKWLIVGVDKIKEFILKSVQKYLNLLPQLVKILFLHTDFLLRWLRLSVTSHFKLLILLVKLITSIKNLHLFLL